MDFPWRNKPTPYTVWISETMLQQTVRSVVVNYFNEWMRRWRTVESVALTDAVELTRFWEGLGYYRRVENLHRAAVVVTHEYGGILPDSYDMLRRLPGIGDYTAAAILSIGYKLPYPVIDANVKRVATRFYGFRDSNARFDNRIRELFCEIIPSRNPGEFSEAVMELGQTICIPRAPRCSECPLSVGCVAYNSGDITTFGIRAHRPEIINRRSFLLIVFCGGKLFVQQPATGRFKRLWLCPTLPYADSSPDNTVREHFYPDAVFQRELPSVVHHYTRYAERLTPVVYKAGSPVSDWVGVWVDKESAAKHAMPSVYRRILNDPQLDVYWLGI